MSSETQIILPRPLGLTIVGWLFVLSGVSTALGMVWGLFHGSINLNLAVLMWPVGAGLLRGRSSSISWARFWTGLGIFGCSLILLVYPFAGDSLRVRLFSSELHGIARHTVAVVLPSLFIVLGVWTWRAGLVQLQGHLLARLGSQQCTL